MFRSSHNNTNTSPDPVKLALAEKELDKLNKLPETIQFRQDEQKLKELNMALSALDNKQVLLREAEWLLPGRNHIKVLVELQAALVQDGQSRYEAAVEKIWGRLNGLDG